MNNPQIVAEADTVVLVNVATRSVDEAERGIWQAAARLALIFLRAANKLCGWPIAVACKATPKINIAVSTFVFIASF